MIFKLEQGAFRLNIGKKFFTMRVEKYWNRLPRHVVEVLSLKTSKVKLDVVLSDAKGIPACYMRVGQNDFQWSLPAQ